MVESGFLDTGDGHQVYWESSGNQNGKPALFLHGGPGSGSGGMAQSLFDPEAYRIVTFDQRGCGRSLPLATQPVVDLATNTTAHLLSDIERLREHLGIARWLVLGGSWGSTLALAYAEGHVHRVSELVLFSVTVSTRRDIDWITRGVGMFFPEAWARFCAGAGEFEHDGLLDAYHHRLMDPDPAIHEKAARDWCDWEVAIVALNPGDKPGGHFRDPSFRLGFARLVTHYWRHNVWLEEGSLLRNAKLLAAVPGLLLHGRLDLGSPLITPWELQRHWPGSELIIIDNAGHGIDQSGMRGRSAMGEHILAATNRFVRS